MRRTWGAAVIGSLLLAVVGACATDEVVVGAEGLAVEPNTPWAQATLEADDVTISMSIGSSPEGDGACESRYEHEVVERPDSVTIAFEQVHGLGIDVETAACPAMAQPQHFAFTLDGPLGDRLIYDGVSEEPRDVQRKAGLLEVGFLPPGFDPAPTALFPMGGPNAWQQTFDGDRNVIDWYVSVVQRPAGSHEPGTDKIGDLEINGHPAELHEAMAGTFHVILWTQDGLDIGVSGEMQGPPTFTHDDELVQIAESVRLPD